MELKKYHQIIQETVAKMVKMSPEQRLIFIADIQSGYCPYCGHENLQRLGEQGTCLYCEDDCNNNE